EDLPDQQAAPRLEPGDVAGGQRPAPVVLRLLAEQRLLVRLRADAVVHRQAEVGAGRLAGETVIAEVAGNFLVVGVEDQFTGRALRLLGVAGDTTAVQDWPHVAPVFHVLDARREAHTGGVLAVPRLAG